MPHEFTKEGIIQLDSVHVIFDTCYVWFYSTNTISSFFIFKTFITFVLFYKIKCDDTQTGCTTYDFRKVYIMCLYTQRETIVESQILFEHE